VTWRTSEHVEVAYGHPLAVFFIFIAYKIVKEIGIMFFLQDVILKKILSCEYKTEDVVGRACGFYSWMCAGRHMYCRLCCVLCRIITSHVICRQVGCKRNVIQIDACLWYAYTFLRMEFCSLLPLLSVPRFPFVFTSLPFLLSRIILPPIYFYLYLSLYFFSFVSLDVTFFFFLYPFYFLHSFVIALIPTWIAHLV